MNKITLHFFYNQRCRSVFLNDVIAFLYERGESDLARELTDRSEGAFDELDKKQWTATYTGGNTSED